MSRISNSRIASDFHSLSNLAAISAQDRDQGETIPTERTRRLEALSLRVQAEFKELVRSGNYTPKSFLRVPGAAMRARLIAEVESEDLKKD